MHVVFPSLRRLKAVRMTAAFSITAIAFLAASCGNFRKLGKDLKMMESEYRISGIIGNADDFQVPVRAVVVEWDPSSNKVYSGDRVDLTTGGAFLFLVKSPLHQYVAAYADENSDGRYNPGEAAWIHQDSDGKPAPAQLSGSQRMVRVKGSLNPSAKIPDGLMQAVTAALGGRQVDDVIRKHGIRFAIGETAALDDPRFAATRGGDGLWTPATFAMESGFGVYFLNRFDAAKTPVLFVHGAAGSPQDWRLAMEKLDRDRYQAWFYVYPSGMRLAHAGSALNDAVKLLHQRYGFQRLHVVAHSMGGLVSRDFIIKNHILGGQRYIQTFITFSSPWDGHEAAAMGVKFAPKVVPSWHDMAHGSGFLTSLYDEQLKGKVQHHLFYSHKASRSPVLPPENDGTVSVASQKRKEAVRDAVEVRGFDEDHVSILSSREALRAGEAILSGAGR